MNIDPTPTAAARPRRRSARGRPLLWVGAVFAVCGVVGLFAVQAWLESYLKSDAFRLKAESAIGKALHAKAQLLPLQRQASVVSTEALALEGGTGAVFRSAKLQGVRAELDLSALWQRTWRVQHLDMQRLELALNPAAGSPPVAGVGAGAQAQPAAAEGSASATSLPEGSAAGSPPVAGAEGQGWLVRLLPNRTHLAAIRTDRASVTRGALQLLNARLSASPASAGWDLVLENGELRHPALPGIDLAEARLNVRPGQGALRRGRLLVKAGGQAALSGEWSPAGAEFHAQLENVAAEPFLPKWWQSRLRGALNGDVVFKQVPGGAEVLSGTLHMSGGKLEALPLLSQLDSFLGTPRFRQVPLKKASVEFSRSGARTELRELDLDADGILRVRGTLVVDAGRLEGKMQLGIPPSVIQWLPPARTRIFGESRDGYVWVPFTVSGTVEQPEEDLTPRLAGALVETVTEAVKKLPPTLPPGVPEAAKGILDSVKSLLPVR